MAGIFERLAGAKSAFLQNATVSDVSCLDWKKNDFCKVMATTMYHKIMHECADRAILPDAVKKEPYSVTVYDSFSPHKRGLVSWIVYAMVEQQHIYLKKTKARDVWLFEKVASSEAKQEDGESIKPEFIELDFREFHQAKIICLLFELMQSIMQAVSKNITVSQALILKLYKLSELIENDQNDKALRQQLDQLNNGIKEGKAGFIDSQSEIDFAKVDTTPAAEGVEFIFSLIANITGLPKSWIFGQVVTGLGSQDEGDKTQLNAAIKYYYFSIYSGVVYSVWDNFFDYRNMLGDINDLVSMFAFIETTTLLTDDGKKRFMLAYTGFDEKDLAIGNKPKAPGASD